MHVCVCLCVPKIREASFLNLTQKLKFCTGFYFHIMFPLLAGHLNSVNGSYIPRLPRPFGVVVCIYLCILLCSFNIMLPYVGGSRLIPRHCTGYCEQCLLPKIYQSCSRYEYTYIHTYIVYTHVTQQSFKCHTHTYVQCKRSMANLFMLFCGSKCGYKFSFC